MVRVRIVVPDEDRARQALHAVAGETLRER